MHVLSVFLILSSLSKNICFLSHHVKLICAMYVCFCSHQLTGECGVGQKTGGASNVNCDDFFYVSSFLFQEYKVSSFEQRLMSEIEFRLERTPVEESDDEVQHDDVPTGKCIAPIFDKKLKNFRAMEGGAVTFSCKIVGIPIPKVRVTAVQVRSYSFTSTPQMQYLHPCIPSGLLVQGWQTDLEEEFPLQEDKRRGWDMCFTHRLYNQ